MTNRPENGTAPTIPIRLRILPGCFTVCKPTDAAGIDLAAPFCFLGRTDEELSLICRTEDVPADTAEREDGWRGLRIEGILDFSLIGILAGLLGILAEHRIGILAVSTFNTDYIFVKKENFDKAARALRDAGYTVE